MVTQGQERAAMKRINETLAGQSPKAMARLIVKDVEWLRDEVLRLEAENRLLKTRLKVERRHGLDLVETEG